MDERFLKKAIFKLRIETRRKVIGIIFKQSHQQFHMLRDGQKIRVSLIICTHNPREDYLRRTMDGIRAQTLPLNDWELLLVDNASEVTLSECLDITWHPNARHVREDTIGLTAARLRGISESSGDLIVFVDDDNVMVSNYLEDGLKIGDHWPMLGAWGGRIDPEFQVEPPAWSQPYWGMLAIRPISKQCWSNDPRHQEAQPWGAGLCVRRLVAETYARNISKDHLRGSLGRIGASLGSCEDTDLVLTSCDLGLGFGLFPELRILHLIPKNRLEENYLVRLHEGMVTSTTILLASRGFTNSPSPESIPRRIINRIKLIRMDRRSRRFWIAGERAKKAAVAALKRA